MRLRQPGIWPGPVRRRITKRGGQTSGRETIGGGVTVPWPMGCEMSDEHATVVIQRHLDELAEDAPP